MRLLLLPIALASVTFAAVHATGEAGPRPIVVLVHGRGHLEDDSAALRQMWKRDLDSALVSVGLPRLANDDFRLAWYADLLDPASDSGCAVTRSSDDSLGLGDFARDFFGSLASALPKGDSREARELIGDLMYALDASRRCAAQRRVGRAVEAAVSEKRPVIVVAYSLGSLVTYGYLSARVTNAKPIDELRLVTIGSPLGNPDIRDLLGQGSDTLRVPFGVRSWENVYDPDDIFAGALEGSMAKQTVRDRITRSASAWDPHHIRRYLRDPATGTAVARALCAASARDLGGPCAKL